METNDGPPTRKIRAIDLKPGMLVIVGEWFDEKDKYEPQSYWSNNLPAKKPTGTPFRVLATALPFITALEIGSGNRGVMDTRLCSFIQVDRAYVKSLYGHFGKREQKSVETNETKRMQYVAKDGGVWREITERRER